MDEQYPSNSKVVKRGAAPEAAQPASPKRKVQPVVTSTVKRREKGLLRKAKEAFVGDDSKGVSEYIFVDILVPGIKKMIEDAITTGVSRKLWGAGVPNHNAPFLRPPNGWMNYQQPSTLRQPTMPQQSSMSPQARANHRFDEIVFTARVDAESVLQQLYGLVGEYSIASVRDFYESAGEPFDFTDENFGWRDLAGAHVRPARGGGYSIALPRPEPIN